jgi:hypothetical protein
VERLLSTDGRQTNSEDNFNLKPQNKTKCTAPTVKLEGPTWSLQEDGTDHEDDEDVDVFPSAVYVKT